MIMIIPPFLKNPLEHFLGSPNLSRRNPEKNICPIALGGPKFSMFPWLRFNGLFRQDSSWVGPGALVKSAAQLKDLQIKAFASSKLTSDSKKVRTYLGGGPSYFSSTGYDEISNAEFPQGNKAAISPIQGQW